MECVYLDNHHQHPRACSRARHKPMLPRECVPVAAGAWQRRRCSLSSAYSVPQCKRLAMSRLQDALFQSIALKIPPRMGRRSFVHAAPDLVAPPRHAPSVWLGSTKTLWGDTPCSDCAAGFYSGVLAAATSNVCVACAQNTYSNKTGATTANVCNSCPYNSSSLQGSSALSHCVCDAPFVKHADETCVCPVDTFYENDPATCTDCQANAQAPMGSNSLLNCICNAGYQGQNGQMCAECHMGKYKSFAGMSP